MNSNFSNSKPETRNSELKTQTPIDYSFLFAILAAFIVGFAKSGFKGLGFLIVTLMALAYESKASTGILLPLLVLGDAFAIVYYRKDVNWQTLKQLFPAMAVGVVVGTFVGDKLSVDVFKQVMAVIIFVSGIMIFLLQRIQKDRIPSHWSFGILMGLGAGFTTMVGNLAGAFTNMYFLAMKFPKRKFIGTAAWLFFFINIFKLPFHIWGWKTINTASLTANLYLAPFVVLGFFVGLKLIEKVSNALFVKYILVMTMLGAVLIWFR